MSILPRFRKSVCGCSLETGSLIIGWWGVIGVLLELVAAICIYITLGEDIEKTIKEESPDVDVLWMHLLFTILFVALSVTLIFNTLLLVGIYKRNHCLILPWLIVSGTGMVFSIFSGAFSLIAAIHDLQLFSLAIISIMCTAFAAYCYLIIHSFYCEIQDERMMNDNRFKPLRA